MVKIYYDLINGGLWTIDNVPSIWREAVQALLDADAE